MSLPYGGADTNGNAIKSGGMVGPAGPMYLPTSRPSQNGSSGHGLSGEPGSGGPSPAAGPPTTTPYDPQPLMPPSQSPYMIMNHKMCQLSLAQPSDLNGNLSDSEPNIFMATAGKNPQNPDSFFEILPAGGDDYFGNPVNGPMCTLESVHSGLQCKLSTIKQLQSDYQGHYRDAQSNYTTFVNTCRSHLNNILHEISVELEQMFRSRMMELNYQKNQLEEILFRIDDKLKEKFEIMGVEDTNASSFMSLFEPEFVSFVRNLLDMGVPPADMRLPPIDGALVDRSLRSQLVPLVKQQSAGLASLDGGFAVPPIDGNGNGNHFENGPTLGSMMLSNQQPPNNSGNNYPPSNNWNAKSPLLSGAMPNNTTEFGEFRVNNQASFYNNLYMSGGNNQDDTVLSSSSSGMFTGQLNGNHSQPSSSTDLSMLNHKQAITKSLQPKVRRDRISYYLKFGEQGAQEGQFAEPSGVAVNPTNDEIYIADANNHRVQVFDKWGKFKFHFGDGKLKFPNRVALSRNTGEIVVSERPPVHQIQVYNRNGVFVCKFGAKHLRHPRGIAVDHKNRVVVVECKVMRVFIFNLQGVLLHSFDCSQQIQFPNAVAVSRKEEIYISDNRNHCVKVFNFAGDFLRQIGGQGITNYPIGVCLNEQAGQLLVVDNYNNLNVTIFRLDGQMLGAYESSVKHQQCLDVALFGDSSIVVTSKDLQVYLYRLKDYINGNQNSGQPVSNRRQFSSGPKNNSGKSHHNH